MDKYNICRITNPKIVEETLKVKKVQKHIQNIYDKHNIPESILTDILTTKTQLQDYENLIVFAIAEEYLSPQELKQYCTEKDIEFFKNKKYEQSSVNFPIKWNMIQVSEDQWIGSISVKQLMELRDSQLINYNANTQRTMKFKTINGEVIGRISLNRNAINKIVKAFEENYYISNTITLNLTSNSEFDYDFETGELIINYVDHFDMLDGYHRYIAMSDIYNRNPNFNYNMELRIVAFPEDKAKQFIYQEDQKTKMAKIDSDTFDQMSAANQLINLLNQSYLLNGKIGKSLTIDSATLGYVLNKLYSLNSKKYKRSQLLALRDELLNGIKFLIDEDPELLNSIWDNTKIIAVFCAIKNNKIDKLNNVLEEAVKREIDIRILRPTSINKIESLFEEV